MGDLTKATAVYYELGASLKLSYGIIIIGDELTGVLFLRFEKLNKGDSGGCDVLSTMRSSASF